MICKMKALNKFFGAALLTAFAVGGATLTQSCQKDDLTYDYDSKLHSFGPSPATRGEKIEILGDGLNGVSKVIFPVGVEVTEFLSKSKDRMEVIVPQEAVPGRIRIILNGEEIVSKSIITFSEPITIEEVSVEKEPLTAGDEIVVKGEYVYNVASVIFGNNAEVTSEEFTAQSRHELRCKVPAAAKTGKITFTDGNDWSFTTDHEYEVTTAEVKRLSKSDLSEGEEFMIEGENLQLVKDVWFPGDIQAEGFVTAEDGSSITLRVPKETCSGVIQLELFSLDRIETPAFTVPTIEVFSVSPVSDVTPGMTLTASGHLLNLVKLIRFPGGEEIATGWNVSADGNSLSFTVPQSMVDGRITFVQNSNISCESESISMAKAGNVFWTGNFELGNWGNNLEIGADKDADVFEAFSSTINSPGKLTINFKQDESSTWWQIQPRYRRDWSIVFASVRDDNGGIINTEAGQSSMTINITQEDIEELNGSGWAFSGCFLTITSMEYETLN